jgi:3-oxoacyl-[acyl-carrier-protein] synthase II
VIFLLLPHSSIFSLTFPSQESHKLALFTSYALAASTEALSSASWNPTSPQLLTRTGITLGTGIGNLSTLFDTSLSYASSNHGINNYKAIHPLFIPRLLPNLAAGALSLRFGFRGPNHCASTACTTGAHSIGDAVRFIQHGSADVMLAGSSEECIHPLALGGFARMRALSTGFNDEPEKASRPFDKKRDGFVIAEGAGVLVLEELEHALERGVGDKILAEVVGYGCTGDAWHITSPRGDGDGAARAMGMAMDEGGTKRGEVGYVNAHATGTGLGDKAENFAIRNVFLGEAGGAGEKERKRRLRVSSTKGAIGHLLGGAGSVEAIFAVLAVNTGRVPPSLNLEGFDDEEGVLAAEGEGGKEGEGRGGEWDDQIDYVPFRPGGIEADSGDVNVALSNSFGFGGTNACLAFRRWEG